MRRVLQRRQHHPEGLSTAAAFEARRRFGPCDRSLLRRESAGQGPSSNRCASSDLSAQPKCGTEIRPLMKNTSVQNQSLVTFPKIISRNLSPPLQHPSYCPALLSWDRMITGIRESGRPMAVPAGCRGWAESLSHVPPGLRVLSKEGPHAPARAKSRDRACGEPHSIQVSTQTAGLHALDFPEISMSRPETGRGKEGTCLC